MNLNGFGTLKTDIKKGVRMLKKIFITTLSLSLSISAFSNELESIELVDTLEQQEVIESELVDRDEVLLDQFEQTLTREQEEILRKITGLNQADPAGGEIITNEVGCWWRNAFRKKEKKHDCHKADPSSRLFRE